MMQLSLKSILFLMVLLIPFSFTLAKQNTDIHPIMRHFTSKDGLPSSEVYDIIQDRNGYIWISTDHGVCRYNGYEFKQFGKEEGLLNPVVLYLFEDYRGWIWMATLKDNFYIYKDDKIVPYAYNHLIQEARAGQKQRIIRGIFVDQEGTLYCKYPITGLVSVNEKGKLDIIAEELDYEWILWEKEDQFFFNYLNKLIPGKKIRYDDEGRVLTSLIRVTEEGSVICRNENVPWYNNLRPFYYYNNFVQQRKQKVLFQAGELLHLINIEKLKCEELRTYEHGVISYFLESKYSDRLYIGHLGGDGGIRMYPNFEALWSEKDQPAVILKGKTISHIIEDKQGGLWIGTNEDGVFYISKPTMLFSTVGDIKLQGTTGLALQGPDSCFVRTKAQKVYSIGTDLQIKELPNKGTLYIDGPSLYYDTVSKKLYRSGTIKYWDGKQWNIEERQTQGIWPMAGKQMDTYRFTPSNYDTNRLFLFGNFFLYSASRENGQWKFPQEAVVFEPRQRLFCIHHSQTGSIYVGAMEGLYLYDEQYEKFILQSQHPAFTDRIESIAELPDSTLIIGTRYDGLVIWKGDTCKHISKEEGLSSPYIKDIHIDANQVIWVGTNAGLNRIILHELDSLEIKVMGIAEGLPSNEITAIKSWGDKIWVATVNGVLKMTTDYKIPSSPVPPIFEQIFVNDKHTPVIQNKYLKWNENNLRLEVTSLDYAQRGRILYRYRFSSKSSWQTTSNPIINLARLSFGKYNFEIQAKGSDGQWSESALWAFTISKPYWKALWFQVLALLFLVSTLIYSFIRYQKRQKDKALQAQQIAEMEQQLESLRQQAYQAQMNPHFIFNCLSAIQSFMLQDPKEMIVASDYLAQFAQLIRQALQASRTKKISLFDDINMLTNYIELEHFRYGFGFDYIIEVDPALDLYYIKIPPMLFQPYVENAIIHGFPELGHRGKLNISFKKIDDKMQVVIQDNGLGVYQTQRKKQLQMDDGTNTHQSIGMEISRKRLSIQSSDSSENEVLIKELTENGHVKGTRVSITLHI